MFRIRRQSAGGFTLIELLLAAALLLAASLTVAVFMSQGIRLFSKLSAAAREEEAAVCAVKMTRDLRNMTFYSLIAFKGEKDKILFASLEDLSDTEGASDPSPFQAGYRFEPEGSRIVRETVRPQTFGQPAVTRTETVLTGVRLLEFEYEGEPQEIPRKVTVRIEYEGQFGPRSILRDVWIPAAPVRSEQR